MPVFSFLDLHVFLDRLQLFGTKWRFYHLMSSLKWAFLKVIICKSKAMTHINVSIKKLTVRP